MIQLLFSFPNSPAFSPLSRFCFLLPFSRLLRDRKRTLPLVLLLLQSGRLPYSCCCCCWWWRESGGECGGWDTGSETFDGVRSLFRLSGEKKDRVGEEVKETVLMVVGGDENKIIHLTMDYERSEGSSPPSLFPSFLFSFSPSLSPPRAKKKWQKEGKARGL